MDLEPHSNGWRATVPEDWAQGRSAFGGLTAALAIRALRARLGDERPLRGIDVAFVGPLGGEVDIAVDVLREGRHLTHATVTLRTEGKVAARAHGVLGTGRESSIKVDVPPPSPSVPFEQATPWPYIAGMMPAFTQHIEFRGSEGDLPFSGSNRATMGGWARIREGVPATIESLVAMTDVWPGPMMPLATKPMPASTIRMSVNVLDPPPAGFDGHYFFRSECTHAAHGYATVGGTMWAEQVAVARMEQLIAYFG